MAARHRKSGGKCSTGDAMLVSGNPNVVKEAEDRKKGGRAGKKLGKMDGKKMKMRMDRPGRKSGGGVGANTTPLSTAHRAVKG